jgi:ankyrin repeat protein
VLASGGYGGKINLWDIRNNEPIFTSTSHKDTITTLAFSHDGKLLVTGGRDKMAKLFLLTGPAYDSLSRVSDAGQVRIPEHIEADTKESQIAGILRNSREVGHPIENDPNELLSWSITWNNEAMTSISMLNGADVFWMDKEGNNYLHWVALKGSLSSAKVFFDNELGSLLHQENAERKTPLHVAVLEGHKDLVELFVSQGAYIDGRDKEANTPLHIAAAYNHKNITEFLIAKGANINAKNSTGQTPLQITKDKGFTEITDLLRKHGAK